MCSFDKVFDDPDEIFYSDEDSDSEIDKTCTNSQYFSKPESLFTSRLGQRQNSMSPDTEHNPGIYIDSPINQVSAGIGSLLSGDARAPRPYGGTGDDLRARVGGVHARSRQPSYSAIMKKQPLSNNTQFNNVKANEICQEKLLRTTSSNKIDTRKTVAVKVSESALASGYRFKSKEPSPDPRYPKDQQLMIGPIPGQLEHDLIYNNLRSIFQSRGPVCFMFIHKSAVRDLESGNSVKFGYVVFAEKGVAQKVSSEGHVTFGGGHRIKVKPMTT